MVEETLDDKVREEKGETSVWDAMTAAYSSSKSVKVLLTTLLSGYGVLDSLLLSSGLYAGLKTVSLGVKYIAKLVANPFRNYSPRKFLRQNLKFYNPLSTPRPTGIGAMLSTTNYMTGF